MAAALLVGGLTFVSRRLGLSEIGALLALWGSLLGSWINIPVARVITVPPPQMREIRVFGVRYLVWSCPSTCWLVRTHGSEGPRCQPSMTRRQGPPGRAGWLVREPAALPSGAYCPA